MLALSLNILLPLGVVIISELDEDDELSGHGMHGGQVVAVTEVVIVVVVDIMVVEVVGFSVGFSVGCMVGFSVGFSVGCMVGFSVGCKVGLVVGLQVNSTHSFPSHETPSPNAGGPLAMRSIQTQPHGTAAVRHSPHVGFVPVKFVHAF